MDFKENKYYKHYKMWSWNDPRISCIAHIHLMPESKNAEEFYHFKISCNKDFCKKESCEMEKCAYNLNYLSINENKTYETFDDCKFAIDIWFAERKDTLYCPQWD